MNVEDPIDVTPDGMVILVRPVQPKNASFPIDVTLVGIVMSVRDVQP